MVSKFQRFLIISKPPPFSFGISHMQQEKADETTQLLIPVCRKTCWIYNNNNNNNNIYIYIYVYIDMYVYIYKYIYI